MFLTINEMVLARRVANAAAEEDDAEALADRPDAGRTEKAHLAACRQHRREAVAAWVKAHGRLGA